MDQLRQPVYKSYRHPNLEKFMIGLGTLCTTFIISTATYGMFQWFGKLIAFAILFLYFLVTKMRTETIYFYDDKGLGPGRLFVFMSNTSLSFKNALVPFAIACITDVLVRTL